MALVALRDSTEPIFIGVAPSSTSPHMRGRRKFANGQEDRLGPVRAQVSAEGAMKASVIEIKGDDDAGRLRSAVGGRAKGKTQKSVKSKAVVGGGKGQMSKGENTVDLFVDDPDSEASETSNRRVTRGAAAGARIKNQKGGSRKVVKFADSNAVVGGGKGKMSQAEEAADLFVDDDDDDVSETSNLRTTCGLAPDAHVKNRKGPARMVIGIQSDENSETLLSSPPSLKRPAKDDGLGRTMSKRAKVKRIKSKAIISSSDEGDGRKDKVAQAMPVAEKTSMSTHIICRRFVLTIYSVERRKPRPQNVEAKPSVPSTASPPRVSPGVSSIPSAAQSTAPPPRASPGASLVPLATGLTVPSSGVLPSAPSAAQPMVPPPIASTGASTMQPMADASANAASNSTPLPGEDVNQPTQYAMNGWQQPLPPLQRFGYVEHAMYPYMQAYAGPSNYPPSHRQGPWSHLPPPPHGGFPDARYYRGIEHPQDVFASNQEPPLMGQAHGGPPDRYYQGIEYPPQAFAPNQRPSAPGPSSDRTHGGFSDPRYYRGVEHPQHTSPSNQNPSVPGPSNEGKA
jgi:hypothetical protein